LANANDSKIETITPRTWLKISAAALVVIVLAFYLLRNVLPGTPANVHAATSGELVQSVVASGRVISPRRVTVARQGSDQGHRTPNTQDT